MKRPLGIALACVIALVTAPPDAMAKPEGTLTVAVATFGNERWLPHLYVGAEDVVLKPLWENLLSRNAKGELIPMLAERWQVTDGGRTWKFHLRKGVRFHNGTELTAEDVKFTFASIVKEGSANSMAPEFRTIKSMEVEGPYTITLRFDKPFVTLGNRVTNGLFASVAYIQSRKHIESGGEYVDELKKVGVRTLVMPNVAAVWVILGGQWPTKPSYDPKVPWAQPDAERAKKVRLALNLAVDKKAIIERVLGGVGTPVGTVNYYPTDPWISDALLKPVPYDSAKAKALLAEAGYPNGFEVTMNLTAWPGRGYLPDVGEAVATYWEKVGLRVKRRPVDRAVFSADFRARSYAGVALAYAGPIIAPEPWELFARIAQTKSAVHLLVEHPKLDAFIERLGVEPSVAERTRIMREEMGPWLNDYMPAVTIGATHSIAGVGPKVGDWPLIPGHMGIHNWEYVTRAAR